MANPGVASDAWIAGAPQVLRHHTPGMHACDDASLGVQTKLRFGRGNNSLDILFNGESCDVGMKMCDHCCLSICWFDRMYLSFGTLTLVCLAAIVIWFWQDSLRVREFANAAATAACEHMGLQFLDGTAAFVRLRFTRDGGRLRLRRTYVFDYTAQSIERRQGFVILTGLYVEYVGFAPEHTAKPSSSNQAAGPSAEAVLPSKSPIPGVSNPMPNNVLDLNVRRAQRAARPDSTPHRDQLH